MSPETSNTERMEKIVSLCKRRGFIFQSSEIYGGINGFWDYGPLGAELKRNLRATWWNAMTREREDVLGLDATIIMHPAIWKASGHVDTFADMMRECPHTRKRVRADHVESQTGVVYSYFGAESSLTAPQIEEFRSNLTSVISQLPTDDLKERAKIETGDLHNGDLSARRVSSFNFQWRDPSEGLVVVRKLLKGVVDSHGGKDSSESVSILLAPGKPPESARKVAREFYEGRGVKNPALLGEQTAKVERTVDFHPESSVGLGPARPFNLMFHTFVGPTATEDDKAYLRPETAQAIFAQFKNVLDSSRQKVPFGICQIGKAFRNEVTPRNFTFRSREFEQMELEFFIPPDEAVRLIHGSVAPWSESADLSAPQPNWGWEMWHRYWVAQRTAYYASIGLGPDVLDYYWQQPADLAHYARACVDILFKFPFGTEELEGVAARGNFDLSQHQQHSGKSQEVFDEELRNAAGQLGEVAKAEFIENIVADWSQRGKTTEEARLFAEKLLKGQYIPHVIEPSAGLDRLALAILAAAYHEEEKPDVNGKIEKRTVLRFHPRVAPVKVGVFPLLKNKPALVAKAREVHALLKRHLHCFYDEAGNIGRRYARQDEAGTPFGVTIDFDTIGENGPDLLDTVTLRHRDDGRQERVAIVDLLPKLLALVS